MAKKRRLRKTGVLNVSEVVESKEEASTPPPAAVPTPTPEPPAAEPPAPKKTLTSWLKGSPKEE